MHTSYRLGSTARKSTQRSCVIPYEMYFLSNIYSLYDTLTNLRMRLKKIAFVLKRIVPQAEQWIFEKACNALWCYSSYVGVTHIT